MTPEQPPPPAIPGAPLAARDPLTGLADRDQFQIQLRNLIAHTSRAGDAALVEFEGASVMLEAHCGVALFPDDAQDAASLVSCANSSRQA